MLHRKLKLTLIVLAVGLSASLLAGTQFFHLRQLSQASQTPQANDVVSAGPFRIEPNVPSVTYDLDESARQELLARFALEHGASLGSVIHVLRFGIGGKPWPVVLSERASALPSLLLDFHQSNEWYGGAFSFVRTRYGMRFVTSKYSDPAAQAHTAQCLSLLAEMGYGLDQSISTPAGPVPLRQFLDDTIATFRMDGELEWTALALGLYLPPQRAWRDRFGTEYTFDDLVSALILSPLESASCFGTHRLYSLAVIFRVDSLCPVLSPEVRNSLATYLAGAAQAVAKTQQDDGALSPSWLDDVISEEWYRGLRRTLGGSDRSEAEVATAGDSRSSWEELRRPTPADLVLATSHHVEWLVLLPRNMQPEPELFTRALPFLIDQLRDAGEEDIDRHFCPYSHAARVMDLLRSSARSNTADKSRGDVVRF